MKGGRQVLNSEMLLMDFSEEGDEPDQRLICREATPEIGIYARREAGHYPVDVIAARSIAVLSLLKAFLVHQGFSARLVYGIPDPDEIDPALISCDQSSESVTVLGGAHLRALGLELPDEQPIMGNWIGAPGHAVVTHGAWRPFAGESEGILALMYIDWEVNDEHRVECFTLREALARYGPHAIVMYLMSTHYGDLLPPLHEGLRRAATEVLTIHRALDGLWAGAPSPTALVAHRDAFEEALADDLDTPTAFMCLFDWIREARTASPNIRVGDRDLRHMLDLLGMGSLTHLLPLSQYHEATVARSQISATSSLWTADFPELQK
jgi:DALR domain